MLTRSPFTCEPLTMLDLIASTNDAKYQRDSGRDTYLDAPGPDSVDLIDMTSFPPRIVASADIETTVIGPPQAVALHPAGRLVVVGATSHFDRATARPVFEDRLQLVDFDAAVPEIVQHVDIGGHPQGLAFTPDGALLLAATTAGSVAVLRLLERRLQLQAELQLSSGRLSGIAIAPDGASALVALRDEQGIAVLDITPYGVSIAPERIASGVAPYSIDICARGRWAVVGNVGLPGLAGTANLLCADADSITLIDLGQRPFRAVQHVSVPSIPEGVAISPDGQWVAVLCMDGSNLPPERPGHRPHGRLQLFALRDGRLNLVDDLPAGIGGQGLSFNADGRYLIAQFNVERQLALFELAAGRLRDTGLRIPRPGGPVSLRALPRRLPPNHGTQAT